MVKFGKPNATGRSSGKWTSKDKKIFGPPKGESWVWQTTELIRSPAWRAMSINTYRLIHFLQIEHQNHAGRENGNLMATYDQLVEYGLPRCNISSAIEEGKFLGLIRVIRGGRWAGTNRPSVYCLTFYVNRDLSSATNEWKGKTAEAIKMWKKSRTGSKKVKKAYKEKTDRSSDSRTTVVRLFELRCAKR